MFFNVEKNRENQVELEWSAVVLEVSFRPAIAAKVLGPDHGVQLTIGSDEGTAGAINGLGAKHVNTSPGEIHVDATNNVVSTPAYMLGPSIAKVFDGIDQLVERVLDLA